MLDQGGELVGHPRWPTLSGSEHLQARSQHGLAPAVVSREVNAHRPAGRPHVAKLLLEAKESQSEPIQNVIIDHGGASPAHRFEHDKHGLAPSLFTPANRSQVSGDLGDCSG